MSKPSAVQKRERLAALQVQLGKLKSKIDSLDQDEAILNSVGGDPGAGSPWGLKQSGGRSARRHHGEPRRLPAPPPLQLPAPTAPVLMAAMPTVVPDAGWGRSMAVDPKDAVYFYNVVEQRQWEDEASPQEMVDTAGGERGYDFTGQTAHAEDMAAAEAEVAQLGDALREASVSPPQTTT